MFICRLRPSTRLRLILDREFPAVSGALWQRVEESRPFHTVYWHSVLHVIWKAWKADQIEACPLLNPFRTRAEEVDWVDGGDRRPHVRAKRGTGRPGTRKDSDALARHQWVQTQLVDLGILQGGVFKEHDVDPDRADVVWETAGIAWEVDLSPLPRAAQETREEVRAAHHYKMIALIDAERRRKAYLGVPTLVIRDLYATAERASNCPEPTAQLEPALQALFVRNAWLLGDVDAHRPWIQRDDVSIRSFCEQYLAGELEYRRAGVHRWNGLRGWILRGANEAFEQKLAELVATRRSIELAARTPVPPTFPTPRSTGREPAYDDKPSRRLSPSAIDTGVERSPPPVAATASTVTPPTSPLVLSVTAARSTSNSSFQWPSPHSVIFIGVLTLALMLMVTWTRSGTPPSQPIPADKSATAEAAAAPVPGATPKKSKKKGQNGRAGGKRAPPPNGATVRVKEGY